MARLIFTFTGPSAKGPFSVPEVKAGDIVTSILINPDGVLPFPYAEQVGVNFVPFVFVDGELIYKQNDDLSAYTYTALIDRDWIVE